LGIYFIEDKVEEHRVQWLENLQRMDDKVHKNKPSVIYRERKGIGRPKKRWKADR
jgi:hypothetical protein